jgi:putative toxin-antitoxin system antitoxin component (TIGR02293 family)
VALLEETRTVLGLNKRDAPDELTLARLVARGLPVRSVSRLIERGIPDHEIYRTVIPRRTFARRLAADARLSPDESDRAERVARVLALATVVLGDNRRAIEWLSTQKQRFAGARPLDLLESTAGAKLVESTLRQAYYGDVG